MPTDKPPSRIAAFCRASMGSTPYGGCLTDTVTKGETEHVHLPTTFRRRDTTSAASPRCQLVIAPSCSSPGLMSMRVWCKVAWLSGS